MKKDSKQMIKLTEMAKAHLVDGENIIYKVLGLYQGQASHAVTWSNGIMIATNKRLLFCNKKHIASFDYEKITNLDLSKKTFNGRTLTFRYNKNHISIANVSDKGNIHLLLSFLSQPKYNKEANYSELFKSTDVPVNNKVKQIKETKCTCQACGKVWYYGKEEAFENFGNKLESFGNSMSNTGKDMMCCTGCLPALFIPEKQQKDVKDLSKCPECGSKAINKEVVVHNVE